MSDYHGRIMNLQIDKKQGAFDDRTPKEILAYKAGHRDARHAAAELAIAADRRIEAAEALAAALLRIANWHGEFPPTERYWDDGTEMSFGAVNGSNGERDFMRELARTALAAWEAKETGK